jgi:hypothetical protein
LFKNLSKNLNNSQPAFMHALFVHTLGVTSGAGVGAGVGADVTLSFELSFALNKILNAIITIKSATESVLKIAIILFEF